MTDVTDGNEGSYFADVVRHEDITRGYINHALSLVVPNTANVFRAPLSASECPSTTPSSSNSGTKKGTGRHDWRKAFHDWWSHFWHYWWH